MQTLGPIETAALGAAAKAITDTWLKPVLDGITQRAKRTAAHLEQNALNRFSDYIAASYERYSYVSTLALQSEKRSLLSIYLPLTVRSDRKRKGLLIDSYRAEFIPQHKKVLLTDAAGMGKSTLLKFLFLSCVKANAAVPVFIELRKLSAERTILDTIYAELAALGEEPDREVVLQFIRQGNFVFFLDGFDEIPLTDREAVSADMQSFIGRASRNQFIVSSRPETSLATFADFHHFTIEPLSVEEAFALLRKYDSSGERAEEIIGKLVDRTLSAVREFLSNPLLVSLLYKSYEHKPTIPLRKHIFYRQVYEALFEAHDLTKGAGFARQKRSDLDIEEFHAVMRALGFGTFREGKIEYDKDELLVHVRAARERCPGLRFREGDLTADLLQTVPLLVRDGILFRWSHKSLQEYFAAQFVCLDTKGRQTDVLRHIYRSQDTLRYLNLLDLCYDMDYRSFRQSVIYELVSDFVAQFDGSFKELSWRPDERELTARKELMFLHGFALIPPAFVGDIPQNGGSDVIRKLISWMREQGRLEVLGSMFAVHRFADGSGLLVSNKREWQIVQLLARKSDAAVAGSVLAADMPSLPDPLPGGFANLLPDGPLIVDDSPECPANQPDHFSELNRLLMAGGTPRLNIGAAREARGQIDLEMARDTREAEEFFGLQ